MGLFDYNWIDNLIKFLVRATQIEMVLLNMENGICIPLI